MLPRAPSQEHDEQEHKQDRDQLEQPQKPAFERADQHVHADMCAIALHVGDAHDRDDRHGRFDIVDIAHHW